MFQGTYQTPFYRQLHALVHRDLELRQRLYAQPVPDPELLAALDQLDHDWFTLGQLEIRYRSLNPTVILKPYGHVHAPDLSKGWN